MMKEVEIKWIINLYASKELSGNIFSRNSHSVKKIEKIAGACENNKAFRIWFKKLVKLGILTKRAKISQHRNIPIAVYSMNKGKLFRYFQSFEEYSKYRKIIVENYV